MERLSTSIILRTGLKAGEGVYYVTVGDAWWNTKDLSASDCERYCSPNYSRGVHYNSNGNYNDCECSTQKPGYRGPK